MKRKIKYLKCVDCRSMIDPKEECQFWKEKKKKTIRPLCQICMDRRVNKNQGGKK